MAARADRDQQSNRTADRAQSAGASGGGGRTSGGSAGRPGGVGTQRSVFTSQDGLSKGISVAPGANLANQNAQRAATYNAAARTWNDSAQQRSLGNFVNAVAPGGFSMEPPDIARPQTFSGSTYHVGWNPGSLLSLAGAMLPGSGIPLGMLGSSAYTALGGKNPVITGPGSQGMPTWDAPGTGQQPNPAGALTPGGGQMSDRNGMTHLQNLAQINQGISGNPSAPQPVNGAQNLAQTPTGPNYANMAASTRQITPNYGIQLPGYQYSKTGATV